ncbi:hypothetical protein FOZ61_006430 [Perkinsus olseni]|uniref:Uncharacterized protein n=1 Tax=Perkinsus olseni TaxID=32597 RepID=A0A7J6LDD7_PEROL|nr:hypothetical protein FOZ61_006430 [Perkinsus olseni]
MGHRIRPRPVRVRPCLGVHITTNPPLLKCPGRQGDYGPGDPVRPQVAGLQDFIEKSEPQLLEKDAMTDDRGQPQPPHVAELRNHLSKDPQASTNEDLVQRAPPPKLPPEPNYVPPPPKGTCYVNPRGYVCVAMDLDAHVTHGLPALPGELLKCYPKVEFTHYQDGMMGPLSDGHGLRTFPHAPSDPDPRYKYLSKSHPSPMARCCDGKITGPWSIHPPPCEADGAYFYWTHAHDHELPIDKFVKHEPAVDDKLALSTYLYSPPHNESVFGNHIARDFVKNAHHGFMDVKRMPIFSRFVYTLSSELESGSK